MTKRKHDRETETSETPVEGPDRDNPPDEASEQLDLEKALAELRRQSGLPEPLSHLVNRVGKARLWDAFNATFGYGHGSEAGTKNASELDETDQARLRMAAALVELNCAHEAGNRDRWREANRKLKQAIRDIGEPSAWTRIDPAEGPDCYRDFRRVFRNARGQFRVDPPFSDPQPLGGRPREPEKLDLVGDYPILHPILQEVLSEPDFDEMLKALAQRARLDPDFLWFDDDLRSCVSRHSGARPLQ